MFYVIKLTWGCYGFDWGIWA